MKFLTLIMTMLLLISCSSSAVNEAKVKVADAVGKYSSEYMKKEAKKNMDEYEYSSLKCDVEIDGLSSKLRKEALKVLKASENKSVIAKSIAGDMAGMACSFLLKQALGMVVAGNFSDYKCAQRVFGMEMEKASDKFCPFLKSKLE